MNVLKARCTWLQESKGTIQASGNPLWVQCIFSQSSPGLTSSELSLGHSHDEEGSGQILPRLCIAQSRVGREHVMEELPEERDS